MATQRWSGLAGLAAAALLLVAGCGDSSSPGEDVPAIASALGEVDDAIVDGRYQQARARLAELVDATASAREAGDLENAEADRILAAAAELTSALQQIEEAPEPDDAPIESEAPDDEASGDEGDSEEDEKELEEEQKKAEEEEKKLEEEKKEDEGGGNGDSSENGPDDGEGN